MNPAHCRLVTPCHTEFHEHRSFNGGGQPGAPEASWPPCFAYPQRLMRNMRRETNVPLAFSLRATCQSWRLTQPKQVMWGGKPLTIGGTDLELSANALTRSFPKRRLLAVRAVSPRGRIIVSSFLPINRFDLLYDSLHRKQGSRPRNDGCPRLQGNHEEVNSAPRSTVQIGKIGWFLDLLQGFGLLRGTARAATMVLGLPSGVRGAMSPNPGALPASQKCSNDAIVML